MNASNVENLSPQTIRAISKELASLVTDPPEGIKIVMNHEDLTDIQAIIDGPAGTPYFGGLFHVRLILGKDFPQGPPKGFFTTKIFHPNVSRTGEICVNTLKKDWKPDLGIKHILLTVKCLLIVPNAESALNEEAGKLLLEAYEDYEKRAMMMTEVHARPSDKLSNSNKCRENTNPALASSSRRATEDDSESNQNVKRIATGSRLSSKPEGTRPKSSVSNAAMRSIKDKKRILKRL